MSRDLLSVLTELSIDIEFAQRFQVAARLQASEAWRPMVAYLTNRGVDLTQAEYLAMAYMIGVQHALAHVERTLERIAAAEQRAM